MKKYETIKDFVKGLWAVFGGVIVLGTYLLYTENALAVTFIATGISGLIANIGFYLLVEMAADLDELVRWQRVDHAEKMRLRNAGEKKQTEDEEVGEETEKE